MTNKMQHHGSHRVISKIRTRAVRLAIWTAATMVPLCIASPRANAQTSYQIIHQFNPAIDGSQPSGLTRDAAGNVIGVAEMNSVFKLDLSTRVLTTLHTFTGAPDGNTPVYPVVLDSAGNIYGTTRSGGANNDGAVFKIDTTGNETISHSFNGTDGKTPNGL